MIEIKHLKKQYELVTPIKDITTTINDGDVISVIGPSGTGKSTLLRMINLLEKPTSGDIFIDGQRITDGKLTSSDIGGKVAMVFQNFNLFNHLSVIENITFAPIKIKKMEPKKAYEKGMHLLSDIGLASFAFSYPDTLSGGQKQRVAIARAIAMDPKVILFDEPTSALDPTMTGEIEFVIKRLASKGYTMLLVTHNMDFAESVANRVFYLDEGGIYEDGTPNQIFHHPSKEKTKIFVKQLKTFTGEIDPEKYDFIDLYTKLNTFLLHTNLSKDHSNRVMSIFEELFISTVSVWKCDSEYKFEISYSVTNKKAYIKTTYKNIDIKSNNISNNIIKHYANEIKNRKLDNNYQQTTYIIY